MNNKTKHDHNSTVSKPVNTALTSTGLTDDFLERAFNGFPFATNKLEDEKLDVSLPRGALLKISVQPSMCAQ